MEYFFTEQQQMVRGLARKIAEEQIVPVRAELDEKALLITFFVLVAMVGLTALGFAVSGQFNNLAGLI